jgi:hypothetical protein
MVNVEPFGITFSVEFCFLNFKKERSIKSGTVAIVTIRGTTFDSFFTNPLVAERK